MGILNAHPTSPFGASAFHLLTVIDFLCLAGGTYLLLILHDRKARFGYLLLATGLAILALRIIPEHLALSSPGLRYAGATLLIAVAGVFVAWGTLSLIEGDEETGSGTPLKRVAIVTAATLAVLGTVFVWALPFWGPLQGLLREVANDSGLITVQHGLRVGVAAAFMACTWITWERRVLGNDLSRMFGMAYLCWAVVLIIGVAGFAAPENASWIAKGISVLGSLFVGNALVLHVYRNERRAAERQQRLELIDSVTSAAIATPRLVPMIEASTEETARLLKAEVAMMYLLDGDDRDRLTLVHATRSCEDPPKELPADGRHPVAAALDEQQAMRMELSVSDEGGEIRGLEGVAVPLTGVVEVVGVLVVGMEPDRGLSSADILTLQNTSAQLGVIVQHMLLVEDIRQARDRWQQTFDSITELVTVHDTDERIILTNEAMLSFVGVAEREALGSRLSEIFADDCEEQEEMLEECIRTGGPPGISMHRTRGRVYQVQVTPVRDEDGEVAGCVRVARDVTSRWRAEERLAQSERRYRELAESANDIIYTHDLDGNFLYVNPAAVRILGYSQEQLSHMSFWDIVADESMATAREYVQCLLDGKPREEQIELRMSCEDGSVVIVQLSANLLRRAGQSEAVHGIARDVTAEKQLTTQLIQADRLASVGTLIAGVAHELNNPLTAISGYADMLAAEPRNDSEAEAIQTIADEATRCRDVAESLLNFARQTDSRLTEFDLNALLRGVFDLRAYDLRAAHIEVVSDLDDDLPPVVGQYGQIQQVIYNIIDNAYYAMSEAGGGTLEVSTWREDESLHVRIADDGPGIPEKLLERVFEPFVTTKPRGEGTGLGLSICQRILEGHDGSISAHNRPNGGAVFSVVLPITTEGMRDEAMTEADNAARETREHEYSARILFIDDEPSLCSLVKEFLTRQGHDVVVASTGEEGLQNAQEGDFDVIVCDMRLPGISGEDVCMGVLEEKPEMADRIMVATGDILSPQTQDFFDRTGLPHIHKPFTLEDLKDAIARLLAQQSVCEE